MDENPLENIKHTTGIYSVIFEGIFYERQELDAMLKYVEENAASLSMNVKLLKEAL